jgi:hypothetical protein
MAKHVLALGPDPAHADLMEIAPFTPDTTPADTVQAVQRWL